MDRRGDAAEAAAARWAFFRGLLAGTSLMVAVDTAADDVEVTPYRPGAANPAELPEPRHLEFELGYNHASADDEREQSLEYLFIYAFTPDSGVQLGGDAWVRALGDDAPAAEGLGDTYLGWKQHWGLSPDQALGLEAGAQFTTAAEGAGEDGTLWIITGIYSQDFGDTRLDLNLGGNAYTQAVAGASHWETAWSAALAWPALPRLEMGVDLSGTVRSGAPDTQLLLVGWGYELNPRLVVDWGLSYGWGGYDAELTWFTGLSALLGRI